MESGEQENIEGTILRFKFRISVESGPFLVMSYGPAFHRWIPSEEDAISLPINKEKVSLRVWFERPPEGLSRFSLRPEPMPEPEEIAQRGVMHGGDLVGEICVSNGPKSGPIFLMFPSVDKNEEMPILIKRIVKALHPPIDRFITVLRVFYGQHWLSSPRAWDSRYQTLAEYCKSIKLQWSAGDVEGWINVSLPETPKPAQETTFYEEYFLIHPQYLTRQDWGNIERLIQEGKEPSLAASLLMRAHQRRGDIRYLLVEAVTAFEIAVIENIDVRFGGTKAAKDIEGALSNVSSRIRLILTSLHAPEITKEDVEMAYEGIDERNNIVHRGQTPSTKAWDRLAALNRITRYLLSDPRPRLIPLPMSFDDTKRTSEEWQELYKKIEPDLES